MKTQQTTIAEVSLIYRTKVKASERLQVKCSKDAFDIFMENWDQDTIEHIEEFKLMLMTRSNKVLGVASISKGGISGTVTDVRVILQYAIKANASGIIICHYVKKKFMQSDIVNMFFFKVYKRKYFA